MRFYEIELNGKTIKFRLKSEDIIKIEELTKKPILDLIKDYSHTNIVTLLRFMRRSDDTNFSQKNANELYDEFIDNDYTMEDVVFKVIYETLAVSGVISKGELQQIIKMKDEAEKENTSKN